MHSFQVRLFTYIDKKLPTIEILSCYLKEYLLQFARLSMFTASFKFTVRQCI